MTEWETLTFPDPAAAARASLPGQIVAPDDAPERTGEFTRAMAAGWGKRFLEERPDDPRGAGLRILVEKEPLWQELEPLLADENWPRVLEVAGRIAELDPGDAAARFNRASAMRNLGDPEAALAAFDEIRELFADEGVYHANRGRTLADLGRRDEAVTAYRRTLELLPGDAFALGQLQALGELVMATSPEGEPVYVERADFEDAVRNDLAQHDGDAGYLSNAANALLQQGHADMARAAAQLALAAQPDREEAHLALGTALHAAGDDRRRPGRARRPHRARADVGRRPRQPVARPAPRGPAGGGARGRGARAGARSRLGHRGAGRRRRRRRSPRRPRSRHRPGGRPPARLGRLARGGRPRPGQDDADAAVEHFERAIDGGADDTAIGQILGELGQRDRIDDVCRLADAVPRLVSRDPGLRWNAATAYERADRAGEARILFASIAHDQRVPTDLRDAARQRAAELGS